MAKKTSANNEYCSLVHNCHNLCERRTLMKHKNFNSGTLPRKINGSSSFCKGPRTSKIWKSKGPIFLFSIVSYATQLFFWKPLCSCDSQKKSKKCFLRHSGCLLQQKGSKVFIVSYATQPFFENPLCSCDDQKKSEKRFLDTVVACWSKRGQKLFILSYATQVF